MQIRVSSALTVYHDGQFWVGMFERIDSDGLSVCRIVFGAEPSDEELLQLICANWNQLRFTLPIEHEKPPKPVSNPKRRQREVSRELAQRGPSTKAQQALAEEREAAALERKAAAREIREQSAEERFALRKQKRKEKHRGR